MSIAALAFSPPVIAHRGARKGAPENTMAAFRLAREQGARWIETDIKLTSDGMPILMHDDTLDRTTNGKGPVADMSWDELRNLDAGGWFGPQFSDEHVPNLAEALHFIISQKMRINLELKPCPGRTQATVMVALIEAAKIWPDDILPPLISSFDIDALIVAARMHPEWPRGLLLDKWREDWREVIAQTKATTLHVNAEILNPERMQEIKREGVPLLAYTVNDSAHAKELLRKGLSAVFTDTPGDIINAL